MREALYKLQGTDVVWRETFQNVSLNSGDSTDVFFLNGVATFNGTSSKIEYQNASGTKSLRIILTPSLTTTEVLKLTSTHNITISSSTVVANGFTGTSIYVNGVSGSAITPGVSNEIVITYTSQVIPDSFVVGQITGYFTGDIELIELYRVELNQYIVSNLYNNTQYVGITQDGLRSLWNFTLGNSNDISGNGNNGVDTNMTYKIQGASFLVGTGAYITLPQPFNEQDFTLGIVLTPVNSADKFIFDGRDGGGDGVLVNFNFQGRARCTYNNSTIKITTNPLTENKTYFLAYTAGNNQLRGFLNSEEQGTPVDITGQVLSVTNNPRIGARAFTSPSGFFNGLIHAMDWYNRVLTPSELERNYQYYRTLFDF